MECAEIFIDLKFSCRSKRAILMNLLRDDLLNFFVSGDDRDFSSILVL